MKHVMLALPVALFAAAAMAQTDTTTETETGNEAVDAITGSGEATTDTSTDTGADASATGTGNSAVDTMTNSGSVGADVSGTGDTEAGSATGPATGNFGTNWPLSVGTTFFTEGESSTLRDTGEISNGWQSLSQEDRDMIVADCELFMVAHGGGADTAASTTTTGTAAVESPATGDATTSAGTDAATIAPTGYSMSQMLAICGAVNGL